MHEMHLPAVAEFLFCYIIIDEVVVEHPIYIRVQNRGSIKDFPCVVVFSVEIMVVKKRLMSY